MAADPRHPASDAALWMLLLLRLTTVTADRRLELRNSAIQTLLRIFDAYGDRLSPEAWSICIKSVVFRLLTSIEAQLETVARADDDSDEEDNEKEEPAKAKAASRDRSEWNETAVVVLNGIAGLLANYLDVLTVHPSFNASWEELLGHFAALLDHKVLDINWAAFKALEQILSRSHVGERESLDKTAVTLAWDLWARGVPVGSESAAAGTGKTTDNHKCLLAYVDALNQIYRLMHGELTRERVQRMLLLLREATEQASVGSSSWGSDVDTVTPLQGRILDVLKTVRTDIPGVPSAMIEQVAEFASLAFREPAQASVASGRKAKVPSASAASGPGSKRTYVAMSKASMSILQSLILRHALEPDVYSSGAFQAALSALRRPIELKYQFTPAGSSSRSVPSWRHATSSAIAILEATLPHLSGTTKPVVRVLPAALDDIWTVVVAIANAIVDADVSTVSSSAATLLDDEDFDIANFHRLRDLLVPALGSASLPERVRTAYAQGLFRTSIVHTPPASEVALVSGLLSSRDKVPQSNGDGDDNNAGTARAASGLAALLRTPRLGRTRDPLPTRRSRMAYVCLDELVALVASQEDKLMEMASTPSITVQPPTPRFPPPRPSNADDDDDSSPEPLHKALVCLARTAAPFLLLRAALALRGYAADQPLRGHMPTPLSQRTELLTVLRCLVALRCDPGVFADAGGDGAGSDGGSAGEDGSIAHKTRHLLRLYPLLVAVGSVAGRCGDDEVAACVAEALDVVGTGLCVSG